MAVRHRQLEKEDISACVDITAAHPLLGPRYGEEIRYLGPVCRTLLSMEALSAAVVFEEDDGNKPSRLLGLGLAGFADDEFCASLKSHPSFWIGPEIVRRVRAGKSPFLSYQALRRANSTGGLNLLIWQSGIRAEDWHRAEVFNYMMLSFLEIHRGFLLKELLAQAESASHLLGMINTGGACIDPRSGLYRDGRMCEEDAAGTLSAPHVVGVTREIALSSPGSWIAALFLHEPPRLGLSRSAQRLIAAALETGTDEETAARLGVSLSAVKRQWNSIYARVNELLPGTIPEHTPADPSRPARGRGRKQALLAYLRKHPEELRPALRPGKLE